MLIRERDGLADLERAVECHNRAWRVGYRGIVPEAVIEAQLRPTDRDALQDLRDEVASEGGAFLVAADDGKVVGFVRGRFTGTSDFVAGLGGEVVSLYVDPAHWREGIGTALLGQCVDWLPNMIEGLSVPVLADNERGRSFLEANGLVHEETVPLEVGGEDLEHAIYRIGFEDEDDGAGDDREVGEDGEDGGGNREDDTGA